MYQWMRSKGINVGDNKCPRCGGTYKDEDYSNEDDMCLWCLFPETGVSRPAEYDETGTINTTNERKILDNLENIPDKQSDSSVKAFNAYKRRNYGKVYKP